MNPDAPLTEGKAQPKRASIVQTGLSFRELPLFGLRTRRLLRYQESTLFTGTANLLASYVYSANGCYDPNITGTGHQPMGFDQMMAFYNHYVVVRSRILVQVMNTTSNQMIHCAILQLSDVTTSTNYQTVIEAGNMTMALLTPTGINGCVALLQDRCDLGRLQGLQQVLDDPEMRGTVAANPTEQSYYHVALWNSQNSTVPTALVTTVIEYDTYFTEPRQPVQS